MDYEKKHEEFVRATQLWENGDITREQLEYIFPEQFNEDEKIRKDLTDFLKRKFENSCSPTPSKKVLTGWIAWLEKQDKEEYALKPFKDEDVRKFMQYIEKQAKAYEFNLPNRSYDIYAFAKDILIWLEKQGEQNPTDKVEPRFKGGDWISNGRCPPLLPL